MKHRGLKNLLTFLLVLVLTIGTVAALSMATQAKTDVTAQAARTVSQDEVQEAAQLSAPVPSAGTEFSLERVGGFLAILAIPGAAVLAYGVAKRRGHDYRAQAGKSRYSPRRDMAFQGSISVKTRV